MADPPSPSPAAERILVIRHGALGDLVLCLDAFAAIRRHHPRAVIVLLTAPAFARFAQAMPWFDEVWTDDRPGFWQWAGWLRLRRRVLGGRFTRVYDLQNSDRTDMLFRLLPRRRRPEWSGRARGCSHPRPPLAGRRLHIRDWMAEQLAAAGLDPAAEADLGWLDAPLDGLDLPGRFVLFVPGSAPHRPEKRWPAERYAALGTRLAAAGVAPVLLGTASEADMTGAIAAACPAARDLTGRTSLAEIGALARRAEGAVGSDTGPMHLIARTGCPTLVLFSAASDPERSRPLGPAVTVLRHLPLHELTVGQVAERLQMR